MPFDAQETAERPVMVDVVTRSHDVELEAREPVVQGSDRRQQAVEAFVCLRSVQPSDKQHTVPGEARCRRCAGLARVRRASEE